MRPLYRKAIRLIGLSLLLCIAITAQAGETAKDNYTTYCTQCHGINGDGKGVNTPDMSVQPRDHSDGKDMSSRSDKDLFKAIKEGGQALSKSSLMPPWGGTFNDDEINDLVSYLRTLCQCEHGKVH